jgi:hypothetical protein
MVKFSIKIDDKSHSLTKENGVSMDKIGELLQTLYKAIDNGHGNKCTLGNIRGNCYALDFYTEEVSLYNNFISVHKNIEQVEYDDLQFEQQKYASTLKSILGGKFYLKAYDSEGQEVAAISDIGKKQLTSYYYTTDTIYGVLSELGSNSLSNHKKHIYVDGINYKIFISKDQDLELKPFYGTNKLRIGLRQKRSTVDGHVVSSELLSFISVGTTTLAESLKEAGYIELNILKDTHTIEDILNKIYENRE